MADDDTTKPTRVKGTAGAARTPKTTAGKAAATGKPPRKAARQPSGATAKSPGTRAKSSAAKAPASAPIPAARPALTTSAPGLSVASAERLAKLSATRFVIFNVDPEIDGGRYAAKRVVGDVVTVAADIVGDGHGRLAARILYRPINDEVWRHAPMTMVENDRWEGSFTVDRNCRWFFTIEVWADEFETWRVDTRKKADAGVDIAVELIEGREIVEAAAKAARGADKTELNALLRAFRDITDPAHLLAQMTGDALAELVARTHPKTNLTRYDRILELFVDREEARFAAWYEMFWRSQGTDPSRGATIDECIDRLDYVVEHGFDVVYLVPFHPIGKTNRKGRNNSLTPAPGDPGSPYAIGSEEGGHEAVHPDWGTLEDFRRFVAECRKRGLEVAMDFAIQCSPDHPWIREHPDWFKWRPDGTIKYAENPPKKYQDIVNVEFYGGHADEIWIALRDIVQFWIDQGITMFRIDNPHTKSFSFWEWLIRDIQDRHPEAIFLAEAFTRPKVMHTLAKLGFNQSYSYFTWRTHKQEIIDYLVELTTKPTSDYMRANFFPSTPDINPAILQTGGRPAHMQRIALAATLSSVYGMYNGYELCEATPVPGKEEFLNSEKYEYKVWDWDRPGHIRDWVTQLNQIRRANPALHVSDNLMFHWSADPNILVYSKLSRDGGNMVLCAVNLDPFSPHESLFDLPLWRIGVPDGGTARMEEQFDGTNFSWTGRTQHIWIDNNRPAFIWRMSAV